MVALYQLRGMSFVKMDFMSYAALEGRFHNASKLRAPTGMAAYNYGLELVARAWNTTGSVTALIDLGISLTLPVGPAGHARHTGCEEMFGAVEYDMNIFAGGWWLSQLYMMDPDTIAFQGDGW